MNAPTLTSRRPERRPSRTSGAGLKIGLFGEFGCGNVGNDASLTAAVAMLRHAQPDAALTCVCRGPELMSDAHGVAAAPMGWLGANPEKFARLPAKARKALAKVLDLPYTVKVLRELDVVVVPGTGIAEQFGIPPWGIPLTLLRLGVASRLARTKLAYLSIGVEPATNRTSKFFLRHALGLAAYRSYRDDFSREGAKSLGVRASGDPVFPDIAFDLPVELAADGDEIGVGVIGYFGPGFAAAERQAANDRYVESMTRVVAQLLDDGRQVRLLTADNADVATARRVATGAVARAGATDAVRFTPSADIGELLEQISHCSVVVASRFHNVIAAMLAERPVVSLGYAPKHRALMTAVGLADFCQDLADLDADQALDQISNALADSARIRATLAQTNEDYRAELARQRENLDARVFGGTAA